jgi:hypothetical protein
MENLAIFGKLQRKCRFLVFKKKFLRTSSNSSYMWNVLSIVKTPCSMLFYIASTWANDLITNIRIDE